MNRNIIIIFIIILLIVIYLGINKYSQFKNNISSNNNIQVKNKIDFDIIKPENRIIEKTKKIVKIRSNCGAVQSDTLMNVINENFKYFNHNLYIPCTYDNIQLEYNLLECDQAGMYFIIDNSDIMVAKDYLAMSLYSYYGDEANKYIPQTWITHNQTSMQNFKNQYNPSQLYIMKKNIQQQKDIQIFNNEFEILNAINGQQNVKYPYVVIQELLQNPYLIDGRKINLRVYVLLIKYNNEYRIYMYNDGKVNYTESLYIPNSTDTKVNVTSGYINKEIYEKNPLTINELQNYLNDESRPLSPIEKKIQRYNMISEYLMTNVSELIKKVFCIFGSKLGNKEKLKNNLKFQLYGVDIAVNEDLHVKLMEINKGPDMNASSGDKRECALKYNVIKDTLKIVDVLDNDKHNGFTRIYYE